MSLCVCVRVVGGSMTMTIEVRKDWLLLASASHASLTFVHYYDH